LRAGVGLTNRAIATYYLSGRTNDRLVAWPPARVAGGDTTTAEAGAVRARGTGLNRVLFGDCRASMRDLIAQGVKVQMCVTSPPYWGLRSYVANDHPDKTLELGLEKIHDCLGWATGAKCGECHVCHMVGVFRLVRDLLADDGTCWINYGDSYSAHAGQRKVTDKAGIKQQSNVASIDAPSRQAHGLKPKDMALMPFRIALALQADGWYVRQDIVWAKKNPMPESVTDRCTKSHEYLFLLSKNERYYYDAEAIKEPCSDETHARQSGNGYKTPDGWDTTTREGEHGSFHKDGREAGHRFRSWHGCRGS
jgi:DNA modification methylase